MKKKKKQPKIELNPQFKKAIRLIEKGNKPLFITGRAGTGKSTLLQHVRNTSKKKMVVLAPTGVAAVNVKGQTIHSFFGFRPDITLQKVKKLDEEKQKLYKKLACIIIDEISMVRADLLDCVDKFLRLNGPDKRQAFGGIQMIFIGDLYQLPPVVTSQDKEAFSAQYDSPYFFSAKLFYPEQSLLPEESNAFQLEILELEKIYRQKDDYFIGILNAIRNNTVTKEEIEEINAHCIVEDEEEHELAMHLVTTNKMAAAVNERKLDALQGEEYAFEARVSGEFPRSHMPTDEYLTLKIGAQIMLLNNDRDGRWINGTIGEILDVEEDEDGEPYLVVELTDGDVVYVDRYRWDMYQFQYNNEEKSVESEIVGAFEQFPCKLAWAVTIHKAQGKTFDHVILDIGKGTFAPGQLYVALSRCTSLEGLVLKRPIAKKNVWTDWAVTKFLTGEEYKKSEAAMSLDKKIRLIQKAIDTKKTLSMTYLKGKNVKSKRQIQPRRVGEMDYMGKTYIGVEAFCLTRKAERVFRVDRILKLHIDE